MYNFWKTAKLFERKNEISQVQTQSQVHNVMSQELEYDDPVFAEDFGYPRCVAPDPPLETDRRRPRQSSGGRPRDLMVGPLGETGSSQHMVKDGRDVIFDQIGAGIWVEILHDRNDDVLPVGKCLDDG